MIPLLPSLSPTFHDQFIQLEELTDHSLPLQHLQLFHTPLHQFLYSSLVILVLVFPERISRSSLGVFSEVVGGKLAGLAEERAVLYIRRRSVFLRVWMCEEKEVVIFLFVLRTAIRVANAAAVFGDVTDAEDSDIRETALHAPCLLLTFWRSFKSYFFAGTKYFTNNVASKPPHHPPTEFRSVRLNIGGDTHIQHRQRSDM